MSFVKYQKLGVSIQITALADGSFDVKFGDDDAVKVYGPNYVRGTLKTAFKRMKFDTTGLTFIVPEYDPDFVMAGTEGTSEYMVLLVAPGLGTLGIRVGPASSLGAEESRIRVQLPPLQDRISGADPFGPLRENFWKGPSVAQPRYSKVVSEENRYSAIRLAATALLSRGTGLVKRNPNLPPFLLEEVDEVFARKKAEEAVALQEGAAGSTEDGVETLVDPTMDDMFAERPSEDRDVESEGHVDVPVDDPLFEQRAQEIFESVTTPDASVTAHYESVAQHASPDAAGVESDSEGYDDAWADDEFVSSLPEFVIAYSGLDRSVGATASRPPENVDGDPFATMPESTVLRGLPGLLATMVLGLDQPYTPGMEDLSSVGLPFDFQDERGDFSGMTPLPHDLSKFMALLGGTCQHMPTSMNVDELRGLLHDANHEVHALELHIEEGESIMARLLVQVAEDQQALEELTRRAHEETHRADAAEAAFARAKVKLEGLGVIAKKRGRKVKKLKAKLAASQAAVAAGEEREAALEARLAFFEAEFNDTAYRDYQLAAE